MVRQDENFDFNEKKMELQNNNINNNTCMIEGYTKLKQIALTLQGEIIVAVEDKTKELCVIKRTSKNLYQTHVSLNGHCINEDFLKETSIIKALSKDPEAPIGFIHYKGMMEDKNNYYLIEEHGGVDLFDYIIDQSKKVKENKLCLKQWQLKVQYIIGTLVETVNYFHTKHRLCHLDLSLENILINSKTMTVKICDFGLSLIFDKNHSNINNTTSISQLDNEFLCCQYAGKLQYKSPEINERKPFDARAADVWAIGVILFIMLSGIPPFEFAHNNDLRFQYIINGKLMDLIKLWKLEENIPKDAMDLLFRIFKVEKERITMEQILHHPYFVKSRQLMVSTKNCKKQETSLPAPSPSPTTKSVTKSTTKSTTKSITKCSTKSTTMVNNAAGATETHPTCQQLQQQIQRQQWIKSTTPCANKQQKPFSLFSKLANTCSSNSELSNNKYKNQQYKISMHAVHPTQASFLL